LVAVCRGRGRRARRVELRRRRGARPDEPGNLCLRE
jgi:hypothetical protein